MEDRLKVTKLIPNDQDRYIIARWVYSLGGELISDSEYTILEGFIKERGLLPEYTSRTWSEDPCPFKLLKKYELTELIEQITLSRDKTESIASLNSVLAVNAKYENLTHNSTVSFKIDGFGFRFRYVNKVLAYGQSRGRSSDALSFDYLDELVPKEINLMGMVDVIGEVALVEGGLEALQKLYPNKNLISRRAAVRTALANKETVKYLRFIAFDIIGLDIDFYTVMMYLEEWGFTTPSFRIVSNYRELMDTVKEMSDEKDSYFVQTDGVVVRDLETGEKKALRIFNWEESIFKSYVIGLKEDPTKHGFNCRAEIFPIFTGNSNQRKVSITNLARLQELNMGLMSPIAFTLVSHAYGNIDMESTRLLIKQWEGRELEYMEMIEEEEKAKIAEKFSNLENSSENTIL